MLDRELLKMRTDVLGINVSQLSPLAQIPPNKLSQFLSGTRSLNNIEIDRLRRAVEDIERLVETAQPYPLNFKNVEVIRDLIVKMKRGELARTHQATT